MAAFAGASCGASTQALRFPPSAKTHRSTPTTSPQCSLTQRRNPLTVAPTEGKLWSIQNPITRSSTRLLRPSVQRYGKAGAKGSSRKQVPLASSIENDSVTVKGTANSSISAQDPSSAGDSSTSKVSSPALGHGKLSHEQNTRLQKESSAIGESGVGELELNGNRPKRIYFDYGFQANFLRTGPTVPRNVIKLAFENFGREFQVRL